MCVGWKTFPYLSQILFFIIVIDRGVISRRFTQDHSSCTVAGKGTGRHGKPFDGLDVFIDVGLVDDEAPEVADAGPIIEKFDRVGEDKKFGFLADRADGRGGDQGMMRRA